MVTVGLYYNFDLNQPVKVTTHNEISRIIREHLASRSGGLTIFAKDTDKHPPYIYLMLDYDSDVLGGWEIQVGSADENGNHWDTFADNEEVLYGRTNEEVRVIFMNHYWNALAEDPEWYK